VRIWVKWKEGAKTYYGLADSGSPDMFFTYGLRVPTELYNGPTCAELQGNWILAAMNYMKEKELEKIEAEQKCEES
jgi:cation diffusion facilitator CzcD-associated flavoprotein CzcO